MRVAKQNSTFEAAFKPSRTFQRLNLYLHLIAFSASIANTLPIQLKLLVAALIIVNLAGTHRTLKSESRMIKHTEKNGWELISENSNDTIEILGSSVITPFAIFLHLKSNAPIVIFYDAMPEDIFRQLLVKLKMSYGKSRT